MNRTVAGERTAGGIERVGAVNCSAIVLTAAILSAVTSAPAAERAKSDARLADEHFVEKVKPLLVARCIACHGREKGEGGLRLDSRDAALKGGDSGPSLVPGKPNESLLLAAVKQSHEHLQMPPKDKLATREIEVLERWIRDGAPWPELPTAAPIEPASAGEAIGDAWTDPRNPIVRIFGGQRLDLWSLKPVKRPPLPNLDAVPDDEGDNWSKNDLDRFVVARLQQDGVSTPAIADSRTIARRLYFDLTGLPPTPEQITAFQRAVREGGIDGAIEQLAAELLAGPRFGEQFARMWLDVVRYSDSNGFDWDEYRPYAWRFRDYVVRSFNSDKPFDQFICEQIAGDELLSGPPITPAEQDALVATGFLRLGPHDNAAGLFNEQDRSRDELLADVTETTAAAFLGLTFSCCRCHDHKYDPLSQADHYRFRAFFAAMKFGDDLPLDIAPVQAEIKSFNDKLDSQVKPLRGQLEALPESDNAARDALQQQINEITRQRRAYTRGLLMTDDAAQVPVTQILFQGNHKTPREAVEPGFPSVFDPQPAKIARPAGASTTARRLTLARWIASAENPLTARVYVNRVWSQLMGRPLVATPNDFGLAGSLPEDPALLDWLGSEFIQQGWSTKKLVRMIVTSATYRQAPTFTYEHFALRKPRRLSAEQLRDSLLHVSGLLTTKSDGPPMWPDLPIEVLHSNPAFLDDNAEKTKGWYPSPKPDQYCRSLFLVQKRNTRVPLLETFDLPDNSTPCARRPVSTVAPQALSLLNSPLAADAARAFAERVQRDAGDDPSQQVRHAFELALQRQPDAAESEACRRLLQQRSLTELCRALVNLNEFVYVD